MGKNPIWAILLGVGSVLALTAFVPPKKNTQVVLYNNDVPTLVKDVVKYQGLGYHVYQTVSQSVSVDNYSVRGQTHFHGTEYGQVIIIMEKD